MRPLLNYSQKGVAPLIIIIVIAAVLAAGGTIYYLAGKRTPGTVPPPETGGEPSGTAATETEKKLDQLEVAVPAFDFSLSVLPDLNISALNLNSASLPAIKPLTGLSVNTDFSFSGNISLAPPVVDFQPSVNVPTGMPTVLPTPGATGAPQPTGAPQVDCSVFASAPSCSYVGAPGSQAYQLCKQCFPDR